MRKIKEPKRLNSFQWVMRELTNPDWKTKIEYEPLTMREKNELIGYILTGQPSMNPEIMTKENIEEAHRFVNCLLSVQRKKHDLHS